MKKIVFLLLSAFLLFGCSEDDTVPVTPQQQQQEQDPQEEEPNENEPVSIAFTEFMAGTHQRGPIGNVYQGGTYVINSQADWNAYLTYPAPFVSTPASTVVFDFNTYTYIALRHDFQSHSSPEIKIYVESVILQNNQITVNYVKRGLEQNQPGFTMETHPFQIIKIPVTTLPINFVQLP